MDLGLPAGWYDGNWIDIGSIVAGIGYALIQRLRGILVCPILSAKVGMCVATGASLFPLTLLGVSVISSSLVVELRSASRLTLSIAGIVAVLAILEQGEPPRLKAPDAS